jgi:hypothetical protein
VIRTTISTLITSASRSPVQLKSHLNICIICPLKFIRVCSAAAREENSIKP